MSGKTIASRSVVAALMTLCVACTGAHPTGPSPASPATAGFQIDAPAASSSSQASCSVDVSSDAIEVLGGLTVHSASLVSTETTYLHMDFRRQGHDNGYSGSYEFYQNHRDTWLPGRIMGVALGLGASQTVSFGATLPRAAGGSPGTGDFTYSGYLGLANQTGYPGFPGGSYSVVLFRWVTGKGTQRILDETLASCTFSIVAPTPTPSPTPTPVPAFTVGISGPGQLSKGQTGTWTATAQGAPGSVTYDWYYSWDGSTYYYHRSGQSYSRTMATTPFWLKVVASSGSQSASAIRYVSYQGVGGEPL